MSYLSASIHVISMASLWSCLSEMKDSKSKQMTCPQSCSYGTVVGTGKIDRPTWKLWWVGRSTDVQRGRGTMHAFTRPQWDCRPFHLHNLSGVTWDVNMLHDGNSFKCTPSLQRTSWGTIKGETHRGTAQRTPLCSAMLKLMTRN